MNKKLLSVFIIIAGIIIIGISLGLLYSQLPSHHPQNSKSACEHVGGDWSDEQEICLLSYKTTGEPCTDGGQCKSGVCFPPTLTTQQKTSLNEGTVKNIVGTCYADDLVTGCVAQVLKGTISKESMCVND